MRTTNHNRIYRFIVTEESQLLFPENPRRKAFLIKNVSADTVEFHESPVAYGQGFPLLTMQFLRDDHFNPQGELYVIADPQKSLEIVVWEIVSHVDYEMVGQ